MFAAGLWLFTYTGSPIVWWLAVIVFFAPDLSFAGYLLGNKVGAFTYNTVHFYGFGAAVLVAGLALDQTMFAGLGALWLGHSGFDRVFGYGLKSDAGFALTHLGKIGKT